MSLSASSMSRTTDRDRLPTRPGRRVTLLARLLALWCVGFALVNVVFEATGHFVDGPLAAYAQGASVMDWVVVGLKLLGAAVALLTVANPRSLVPPALVTVLAWGAFALLGVYALGNVVEAIGMATGLSGDPGQITPRNVAYVLFFLPAAAGYGILAISYSRRVGFRRWYALLGVIGGPLVIALLLLAIPALLASLGILPA